MSRKPSGSTDRRWFSSIAGDLTLAEVMRMARFRDLCPEATYAQVSTRMRDGMLTLTDIAALARTCGANPIDAIRSLRSGFVTPDDVITCRAIGGVPVPVEVLNDDALRELEAKILSGELLDQVRHEISHRDKPHGRVPTAPVYDELPDPIDEYVAQSSLF